MNKSKPPYRAEIADKVSEMYVIPIILCNPKALEQTIGRVRASGDIKIVNIEVPKG